MHRYYCEVHEARRYSTNVIAHSEEEAQQIARDLVRRGELPHDTLDLEAIAVSNAWKEVA